MLTAIKEIINPDVVLEICTGDKTLTIKENDRGSKIKKLCIKDIPENAFAFTLDYQPRNNRCFQQLSCYVNKANQKGVNKGCDLVLLIPKTKGDYDYQILIFDLKSDKPSPKDTNKQLLNSELYVRYLLSMVQEHYYDINTRKIEFKRAIVITSERKKAPYRPNENKDSEDISEKFTRISVSPGNKAFVHLNQLLE